MNFEPLRLGSATLYHGDCLEILAQLPQVDLVLTDPPYSSGGLMRSDRVAASGSKYTDRAYMNFSGDNRDQFSMLHWCAWWLGKLSARMRPGGAMLSFIDWRNLALLHTAIQMAGLVLRGIAPWNKTEAARPQKGCFRAQCEYILYATKGALRSDAILPGFFTYPVEQNKLHPTQKPKSLIHSIIKILPEGVILDPFMGSGSTGVAAIEAGREFIGIEMDDPYFDVACQRIRQAVYGSSLLRRENQKEQAALTDLPGMEASCEFNIGGE